MTRQQILDMLEIMKEAAKSNDLKEMIDQLIDEIRIRKIQ